MLQPYRNLRKLFQKDEVISHDSSIIFRIAPYIIFAVTLIVGASIPLFTSVLSGPTGDLLVIVYLLALGTFFLALAGMDTGGGFGGFGSSREMTLAALAEGSIVFSMFALVLLTHTTNLVGISGVIDGSYDHYLVPIAIAFMGFFVALLAETSRFPFDNPDTHLELTMIHEAMLLEYSGKRLALMEWAAANKLMIFVALAVNLFFPIGLAHDASLAASLQGIGWMIVRMSVVYTAIAILESSIAKFRFFRLPDLLLIAFILCAVAVGLVG